jgi:hypothetical protein
MFKRFVISLLAALSLMTPAFAQLQPISYQLLQQCTQAIQAAGVPIVGLEVSGGQAPSASNVVIDFSPSATSDQRAGAAAIVAAFPWGMNAPNVIGFITAVNADPLSTANNQQLIFQMGSMLAIFQADMTGSNIPALQGHWQSAIANYGPSGTQGTWLTTQVQTMLLGYANSYNIPLVAPSP